MERLSLKVLNNVLNVMETIRDCCGGFGDSLEECKYEFLKQHKHFLELKEQGRLPELPCAVGDKVYMVYRFLDEGALEIEEHKIKLEDLDKIGETVFLTRKEAEEALKRMEDGNE